MQYGATFRSLRRSKGLTLKQVADDVNSISLISQFEHDQLHISTERFIHLLDRIAVSFDEFQVIRTGTAKSVSEQQIEAYLNLIRYSYDRLSHPYDHEAIDQRLTMLERQNENVTVFNWIIFCKFAMAMRISDIPRTCQGLPIIYKMLINGGCMKCACLSKVRGFSFGSQPSIHRQC
ncbi:UpsR [Lacticaseibacillus paracasei subsp. paracasei Lpp227]|nr:UpsR [Lacticaseibacillus paracasei subsp. paracasei Lpp227]